MDFNNYSTLSKTKSKIITFDDESVAFGRKRYKITSSGNIGDLLSDVGTKMYDGKIIWYPDGRHQIVKASDKIFRVPIPGVLPKKRKNQEYFSYYDEDPEDEENKKSRMRDDNLQRAQTRVKQIILLNKWRWFITLTFDDNKVDAANVKSVIKKTQNWLRNMTARKNFGYVLVPEYHKKKNRIHLHLLALGDDLELGFDNVYKVDGFKKPMRLAKIKRKGLEDKIICPVYNLKDWHYGLSSVIECYGDTFEALSNYVLKEYVTKTTGDIFGKYYWCSKNIELYPVIELYDLDPYEFNETIAKRFYVGGSCAAFKYINRLGYNIDNLEE